MPFSNPQIEANKHDKTIIYKLRNFIDTNEKEFLKGCSFYFLVDRSDKDGLKSALEDFGLTNADIKDQSAMNLAREWMKTAMYPYGEVGK